VQTYFSIFDSYKYFQIGHLMTIIMRQVREDEQLGSVYLENSNALLKLVEEVLTPEVSVITSLIATD
jgi:hypothetical protein